MGQRWNPERSKLAHAAKARARLAGPSPDYPAAIEYDLPVESWTIRRHALGDVHKLVLFPSRRRVNCFRVMVDGREWSRCIGYDRLLRQTVKALAR